ncbi:cysteine desulfurase [candidate division WOR-3 bacterium]|uniref:cysteine desulfurase n=1 Tax=candidate division WOR-3 bacterium TaxID=2052148 RepID=A0A660SGJ9_UNCW3|nr:MAG: cysteine desulfurase [candidate division WOR-3 bacterium]
MNPTEVRKDFPQLKDGHIYFDSAATSLKPLPVIEAVNYYYTKLSANVERGLHRPSHFATRMYEEAHHRLLKFINGTGEVIFTKNCTEAINLIAHGLDWKEGDEIITTFLEHNSNLLPWFYLRRRGVRVTLIRCDSEGLIDLDELSRSISSRTRLIALTHASNVLGTIQPISSVVEIAHRRGVKVLVDGAQAAPHLKLDLDSLGCDFYAASGHKMLGPSGTGFLFIRDGVIGEVNPCLLGGGTVKDVDLDQIILADGFERYEAGTPNIAGGIGLGAAVDYLERIGMENVRSHELELTGYAIEKLKTIKGIRIHGPQDPRKKTGVVAFSLPKIPSHRVAIILDEVGGIAVRSGYHCAFLLTRNILKEDLGTARASFYIYNTKEEIDQMVEVLEEIV